ncbi:hypothetical protein SPBRAN_1088 [uncultured Candidatus Thioglobus sp.]|nr:hypothetical protein SPBRAN_1088 [uncultured Candidatus Thioglobus sp.]
MHPLIKKLEKFKAGLRCTNLECSTCGEFIYAVRDDLMVNSGDEIKHYLLEMPLNEFENLDDDWKYLLQKFCPDEMSPLLLQLSNKKHDRLMSELNEKHERLMSELNKVKCILKQAEINIDTVDIREVDNFLFQLKNSTRYECYQKLLDLGIKMAIKNNDNSLIETLAIILGERILNQKQLFNLAMSNIKVHKNIHRVLYNNLRQKVPEVRGYVGNGGSFRTY